MTATVISSVPSDGQSNARVEAPAVLTRVAHVTAGPYGRMEHENWGVAAMAERGIRCEVFDAGIIWHRKAARPAKAFDVPAHVQAHQVRTRENIADMQRTLADCDVIFSHVSGGLVTPTNLPVLRAICRSGRPYIVFSQNAMPGVANFSGADGNKRQRMKNILQRLPSLSFAASVIARLPLRYLGLRPASAVVLGGYRSERPHSLITCQTKRIWAHATDYEVASNTQAAPPSHPTAVFIDQYMPYHRDWVLVPGVKGIDADNYYGGLRTLFDRIEREKGIEVVIAQHPRANYHGKENLFGGRPIIEGRTAELVKASSLVITSTSMTLNQAVAMRKPMLIYTTHDHYANPTVWRYLDPICKELDRRLIYLEDAASTQLDDILTVNDALYDRFVDNYLKKPASPDGAFWNIVLDAVSPQELSIAN